MPNSINEPVIFASKRYDEYHVYGEQTITLELTVNAPVGSTLGFSGVPGGPALSFDPAHAVIDASGSSPVKVTFSVGTMQLGGSRVVEFDYDWFYGPSMERRRGAVTIGKVVDVARDSNIPPTGIWGVDFGAESSVIVAGVTNSHRVKVIDGFPMPSMHEVNGVNIRDLKSRVGSAEQMCVPAGDHTTTWKSVIVGYLTRMFIEAIRKERRLPATLVITVPTLWTRGLIVAYTRMVEAALVAAGVIDETIKRIEIVAMDEGMTSGVSALDTLIESLGNQVATRGVLRVDDTTSSCDFLTLDVGASTIDVSLLSVKTSGDLDRQLVSTLHLLGQTGFPFGGYAFTRMLALHLLAKHYDRYLAEDDAERELVKLLVSGEIDPSDPLIVGYDSSDAIVSRHQTALDGLSNAINPNDERFRHWLLNLADEVKREWFGGTGDLLAEVELKEGEKLQVDRETVSKLFEPALKMICTRIDKMGEIISKSRGVPARLDFICLTGQGSFLPGIGTESSSFINRLSTNFFKRHWFRVLTSQDPTTAKQAVARGAVLSRLSQLQNSAHRWELSARVVLPFDIGLSDHTFRVLVPRGTELPCEVMVDAQRYSLFRQDCSDETSRVGLGEVNFGVPEDSRKRKLRVSENFAVTNQDNEDMVSYVREPRWLQPPRWFGGDVSTW